jgi:hypothetical protein
MARLILVKITHWKTTVAGVLSAFLATVGPATSFLAAYDTLIQQLPGHSHADFRVAIWGAALTCAAAVARAWIGLISADAPDPPPPADSVVSSGPTTPVAKGPNA